MIFMECFGELPYDVGYQKKHVRPHGEGWGLLLYPAQPSPSWLNFLQGENMSFFSFLIFFRKHCLHNVLNLHQLPNRTHLCNDNQDNQVTWDLNMHQEKKMFHGTFFDFRAQKCI